MRISDWSSDVCSSDLAPGERAGVEDGEAGEERGQWRPPARIGRGPREQWQRRAPPQLADGSQPEVAQDGRSPFVERTSVPAREREGCRQHRREERYANGQTGVEEEPCRADPHSPRDPPGTAPTTEPH